MIAAYMHGSKTMPQVPASASHQDVQPTVASSSVPTEEAAQKDVLIEATNEAPTGSGLIVFAPNVADGRIAMASPEDAKAAMEMNEQIKKQQGL